MINMKINVQKILKKIKMHLSFAQNMNIFFMTILSLVVPCYFLIDISIFLFILPDEYVICLGCKSPDTILSKENRLFFLRCEKVGSKICSSPFYGLRDCYI